MRWLNAVRDDPEMGWKAVAVAAVLATQCTGGDQPRSIMPVARIAERCRLSQTTVKEGLRELAARQWVVALHRHRKACTASRCVGCAATQWLMIPRPDAVEIPAPRRDTPPSPAQHAPPRGAQHAPLKTKNPSKSSNVVAFVDRFGRLP